MEHFNVWKLDQSIRKILLLPFVAELAWKHLSSARVFCCIHLVAVVVGQTSAHSWVECSGLILGYCPWVVCSAGRDWHLQIPQFFLFLLWALLPDCQSFFLYSWFWCENFMQSSFSFTYCMRKTSCMIWLTNTFLLYVLIEFSFLLLWNIAWHILICFHQWAHFFYPTLLTFLQSIQRCLLYPDS